MWIFVALKATLVSYKWLFQQLSLYISDNTSRSIGKIKKNKFDFKGHLQRNAKPISNQNLCSRFQSGSWTVAQKMKSRDQAVLGMFIWKNQAIWLAKRILGSKLKNQNVKLLEMTIFFFFRCYPHAKNQHYISSHSWHIANLIIGITFCMPRCAWPHPYHWTESKRCIYGCLTTFNLS